MGAGSGQWVEFLVKKGYDVTGADFTEMSELSHKQKNLKYIKVNIEDELTFENESYDIIWCQEVLEHLYSPLYALKQFHRILKNSGKLFILCPNSSFWKARLVYLLKGKTPSEIQSYAHIRFFNVKMVERLFYKAGFKYIKSLSSALFDQTIKVVGIKKK